MKRYKYRIGDVVKIKALTEFCQTQEGCITRREMDKVPLDPPWIGIICGAATRFTGIVNSASYSYDGECDPAYLGVEKSHTVYLVRQGMTNKSLQVSEEDIEQMPPIVSELYRNNLPWRRINISDNDRKVMSEASKEFPRDEDGKFIKENYDAHNS